MRTHLKQQLVATVLRPGGQAPAAAPRPRLAGPVRGHRQDRWASVTQSAKRSFAQLSAALVLLLAPAGPDRVHAQTPPAFPPEVTGQRQVAWNYTGLRPIPAVPAIGVHPRIFVGPDQRAEVCHRLTNTVAGRELFTNLIQRYTLILRHGHSAYDTNAASIKTMPDGTARLGNVGYYDQSWYYTNLVARQMDNIASMMTNVSGPVFARTLGGAMALEAMECWVLQGQAGVGQRATNLATALATWSSYLLSRADYTNVSKNWMFGGGAAIAEAYDFNYWAMTPAQRTAVRQALVRIINPPPYYGVGLAPEAATSNWASLNTFWLIMMMAIEGETSVAVEGYDPAYFESYFTNAMQSTYKFLTYGWHPSGEMYEGMGKGWFGGARMIAFAKRGYNFFGHAHLQNYVNLNWPACLQPFGYSWTHYDLIGGSGADDDRGLRYYTASDQVALQWVYTNSPAAAFLWRNFATTAWRTNSTNGYRTFLDFRDSKFAVSTVYGQDVIEAACFVQDVSTNNWNTENALARPSLDFVDTLGSTIVARSGSDSNAVALQFHTRQDFGGHTYADRGGFSLSGLGRVWVKFPFTYRYGQDSGFNSQCLVDDLGAFVTPQDGDKMRVPAKLAGWTNNSSALFATCDSTYSYTWKWKWNHYLTNRTVTISSGYQAETNAYNHFRRSNNQIPEDYGNTPFVAFPDWNAPGYLEGMQRATYNPMRQVLRTAGLVRGVRPYALILDDIQKDSTRRVYKWLLQLPWDLTLKTNITLPPGFNPATDAVLQENATSGTRSLLVRIMSPTNWLAYTEIASNSAMTTEGFYRLTVTSTSAAPAFKIMLYPFAAGDPIPTNTWTSSNNLTVTLGGQTDSFAFAPRTVTTSDGRSVVMSEFTLSRAGSPLLDYRYQIEPFASVLRPAASVSPGTTNVECGSRVTLTATATGTPPLSYQWRDPSGAILAGQTNATLSLPDLHPAQAGSYQVVVTNASGSATNFAFVTVTDSLPPVVALHGANPLYVELGGGFTDPGGTASDACAGSLAVSANGVVNPGVPGTYPVSYTATDPSGHSATNTRSVIVRDTTPPTILWSFTQLVLTATANGHTSLPDVTGTNFIQATDLSGAVFVTQTPPAGTSLPLGTNIVVLTVADASANQSYATNCVTVVPSLTPPVFTSIALAGRHVIVTGTNGTEGATYLVLRTADLATPRADWLPVFTNQFGPGGGFRFTNPVAPTAPPEYYLLQLP